MDIDKVNDSDTETIICMIKLMCIFCQGLLVAFFQFNLLSTILALQTGLWRPNLKDQFYIHEEK